MKISAKYLIIGPRIYIGGTPFRNIHLIDPERERTMCGRTPHSDNTTPRRDRWVSIDKKSSCKCKLRECATCRQFTTHFAEETRKG